MVPGVGSVAMATGVFVGVSVTIGMDVNVGVEVPVAVELSVGVDTRVAVAVSTCVAAGASVRVGFGFDVGDGVDGKNIRVLVGFVVTIAVWVADETAVGVTGNVEVIAGIGVPVINEAPGVRKRFSQAGCVNMDELTGSINPSALWVRKSLFGSRS